MPKLLTAHQVAEWGDIPVRLIPEPDRDRITELLRWLIDRGREYRERQKARNWLCAVFLVGNCSVCLGILNSFHTLKLL